jgi:hypothetical protein
MGPTDSDNNSAKVRELENGEWEIDIRQSHGRNSVIRGTPYLIPCILLLSQLLGPLMQFEITTGCANS